MTFLRKVVVVARMKDFPSASVYSKKNGLSIEGSVKFAKKCSILGVVC